MKSSNWVGLLLFVLASAVQADKHAPDVNPAVAPDNIPQLEAREILEHAMDQWRGLSSVSEMTMTITREDWQRSMSMKAWTKGDKQSLVRVTAPKKDAGNGTLLLDNDMWSYTPKINRVIKIPSSMMSQSWMGSDFTNKDISKSTDVLDQYSHRLLETLEKEGHTLYWLEAVPHEDAAVVWGKELYLIRDDFVMLEQQFWDQDNVLVKTLKTLEIKQMGGRVVASKMRMGELENPKEWTEMETHHIEFDAELPANLFTLSNLRNPR
ncbi:outer membrane lipoprotein-sorting protein [Alteromonadaceae bacterium 2753L.S.0a.02]|nr:outer membrane lipoprotein-sorting protein [Alteromonadaceae bacterium 2753L.S.0a.02]